MYHIGGQDVGGVDPEPRVRVPAGRRPCQLGTDYMSYLVVTLSCGQTATVCHFCHITIVSAVLEHYPSAPAVVCVCVRVDSPLLNALVRLKLLDRQKVKFTTRIRPTSLSH